MVLVIAAVLLAFFIVIALVATRRKDAADEQAETTRNTDKLPVGADAALWSIVEAVPDPRNHLALTRDLTGEVRIAGTILDSELHLERIPVGILAGAKPVGRVAPVITGTGSVRIIAERIQSADQLAQDGDSLGRAS